MNEYDLLKAAVAAFAVTVALMLALRPLSHRIGLVDKPGGRKLHDGEVPIIGGIAMFFGMFAGLWLLPESGYELGFIASACAILLIIGVFDDLYHLSASLRLGSQVIATLIMVYGAGLPLSGIGEPFGMGEVAMGRFTLVFTMLVTLSMINAYNLIDGADGLAASLSLITLLAIAAAVGIHHATAVTAMTVSAAVLGFLVFNFPTSWNRPVRAFMGDGGSTLLGFSIVWITLGVSQEPERLISPVHCLWFASVPIYDIFTCFVRRMLKGKSPFAAGRDHFHHVLLRGGFSVREMLAVMTALQAGYALIGLAGHFFGIADVVMFSAWSVLGISQRWIISFVARHSRAARLRRRRFATP